MTDLIERLADISHRYEAVLCDLWGCLHNGEKPFPAAVQALEEFRAGGGVVILLTNAPRPKSAVAKQLKKMGVPDGAYDDIVSSGDASQIGMVAGMVGKKVYHLGPAKDATFFTDFADNLDGSIITRVPLNEAEGIVCTGLFDDRTEKPYDYRATLLYAKQKGLKLLCTNPDIVVDMGETRIFCAGALAELYTEMGGESLYFGKPHSPIYSLARRRLMARKPVSDENILCIGDGINTDVLGGMNEGFDTLFITQGLAAGEFGSNPDRPDRKKLKAYFDTNKLSATAAIPFLR